MNYLLQLFHEAIYNLQGKSQKGIVNCRLLLKINNINYGGCYCSYVLKSFKYSFNASSACILVTIVGTPDIIFISKYFTKYCSDRGKRVRKLHCHPVLTYPVNFSALANREVVEI